MVLETVIHLTGKAEVIDMISSAWQHAAVPSLTLLGTVNTVARINEDKDKDILMYMERKQDMYL